MKPRHLFLFVLISILFLFYPGSEPYYELFAYNSHLFVDLPPATALTTKTPVPMVKNIFPPVITASGAYVIDLASFTPVFARNEQAKLYPASTTKVITALVAIDLYKPEDIITIKPVHNEGQVMGLVEGERITFENLLYGLLVYSGNDAAYALADSYGYDKFIALMNKKAAQLHMKSSHFANPAGLDDPNQYTSAFDLTLASRELLNHPLLRKIVSTKEITISDVDFQIFHRLENVNKLLGEIQGIGGLKTGYTEAAGENLVSFYRKHGHEYLIVILKSADRFADTRSVVTWLDNSIEYLPIQK